MKRCLAAILCLSLLATAATACPATRVNAPPGSEPSPARVENRPAPSVVLYGLDCSPADTVLFGADAQTRDLLDTFGALVRVRAASLPGVRGTAFAAIAAYPAGDGVLFQLRLLLRGHARWRVLPNQPVSARGEGGLFVGALGRGEGSGIAAWQVVFAPGETHVGRHRWVLRRWRVTQHGSRRLPDLLTATTIASDAEAWRQWGVRYRDMTRGVPGFAALR